jgi:ribose-phosphate pyrophosphokinase
MIYLNLSEGFNPLSSNPFNTLACNTFTFKGGEPHIVINDSSHNSREIIITQRINSFNDLGLLCVAVDAVKRMKAFDIMHLFIPYMPGARQDRQMVNGEPLTVKVYGDIINSLGFNTVAVLDPHSDVTGAVLDSPVILSNIPFVTNVFENLVKDKGIGNDGYLVSPDAGANKKVTNCLKSLHGKSNLTGFTMLKCDKTRDVTNGKLTGFEVYGENLMGKPCVIVDDICDGGGTFIGLANELKNKGAGDIYLVVTHGIFSQGFKLLESVLKGIYTTDSIKSAHHYDSTENKNQGVTPSTLTIIPSSTFIRL